MNRLERLNAKIAQIQQQSEQVDRKLAQAQKELDAIVAQTAALDRKVAEDAEILKGWKE
jgi:peptidoglycan hydrolase CwlO-like protein